MGLEPIMGSILIYHGGETVNVVVAMEATSTLNIAHMTLLHCHQYILLRDSESFTVSRLQVCIHNALLNDELVYTKCVAECNMRRYPFLLDSLVVYTSPRQKPKLYQTAIWHLLIPSVG